MDLIYLIVIDFITVMPANYFAQLLVMVFIKLVAYFGVLSWLYIDYGVPKLRGHCKTLKSEARGKGCLNQSYVHLGFLRNVLQR